ncbi:NAD(P)H-dependent oxidoreductase [Colwellia sp. D2M02]|uniref:NAD(P)H-dependent oxidoreductase n=1 Tax=Colwellia sp. D2M02 TaxID=2841562 RepID=UPI001C0900A6|nr:NAD(P)H-dependent oxidoreductase [Colwellia sp. D2M02]MBU2892481.1 NAD(P)H-dependent oxidoreductase [Colwellia sp. D2M02]
MKKILVINANPKSISFCKSIAERYAKTAGSKHALKQIDLNAMNFEINLQEGYDKELALEPDLVAFQEMLLWAEHIVIISPVWWGSMPAKFKGVIDRTFLPDFAFKYHKGKSIPEKLLKGRTSELIITLDTPTFWYKYVQGNPIYKNLKRTILDFSGIKNTSATYFGPVISASEQVRKTWLTKVEKMANNL